MRKLERGPFVIDVLCSGNLDVYLTTRCSVRNKIGMKLGKLLDFAATRIRFFQTLFCYIKIRSPIN